MPNDISDKFKLLYIDSGGGEGLEYELFHDEISVGNITKLPNKTYRTTLPDGKLVGVFKSLLEARIVLAKACK
jgi:hypothetical protein